MFNCNSSSADETKTIGIALGSILKGGEVIECVSDLGGGKTTIISGIAQGLECKDLVSSPSFTICNTYRCKDGKQVYHYDFYRLDEPGIMKNELAEAISEQSNIVLIEWGDKVEDVLPKSKITIKIDLLKSGNRKITISPLDNAVIKKLSAELDKLKK